MHRCQGSRARDPRSHFQAHLQPAPGGERCATLLDVLSVFARLFVVVSSFRPVADAQGPLAALPRGSGLFLAGHVVSAVTAHDAGMMRQPVHLWRCGTRRACRALFVLSTRLLLLHSFLELHLHSLWVSVIAPQDSRCSQFAKRNVWMGCNAALFHSFKTHFCLLLLFSSYTT